MDALEPVALERLPDEASVAAEHHAGFTAGAVRSIGEVTRRSVPSRWDYQDRGEDPPSPYNRVPVLRSNTPLDFMRAVAPEFRLRLLARDRAPGILRKIVNPLLSVVEEARDAGFQ